MAADVERSLARSLTLPFRAPSVGPERWRRLDEVVVVGPVELGCWCWGKGLAANELKLRLKVGRETALVDVGEEGWRAGPKPEPCDGWKFTGVIRRGEVLRRVD